MRRPIDSSKEHQNDHLIIVYGKRYKRCDIAPERHVQTGWCEHEEEGRDRRRTEYDVVRLLGQSSEDGADMN